MSAKDQNPEDHSGPETTFWDGGQLVAAILSSSLDCIIVSNEQGQIVEFNPAAERTFGHQRSRVLGQRLEDTIIPLEMRASHVTGMSRYMAGAAPRMLNRRVETEALHADGHVFPVEMSITEAVADGQRIFVANLRDITASRAAAVELHRARASLQAFFDHIPVGIYINRVDPARIEEMTLEFANEALAAPYGMPASQILGLKPYEDFGDQLRELVTPIDRKILLTKKAASFEAFNPVTGRYEIYSRFPILNALGEITHIGGMNLDVHERELAKISLEETRATLSAFFAHIPAGVFLARVDPDAPEDMAIEFANETLAGQHGMTADQMIGKRPYHDFGHDQAAMIAAADRRVIETREAVQAEVSNPVTRRHELIVRFPILGSAGNVTHIGSIALDIDERVKAQLALAEQRQALHQSEKLAALGTLLAGVAHELNNPLSIVLGRAALLEERLAGSVHSAPLAKLHEAADRCSRIVRTFLAMARQSGPVRRQVNLNELLEGTLDLMADGLRSAGIELTRRFDASLPDTFADGDQLVQVMINLIVNAQHALDKKQGPRRLDLMTSFNVENGTAVLSIGDNGPGVRQANRSRIFEPFFTTKAVGAGTGMGLSFCKGMIEAHGGALDLVETPGGGATFVITLPLIADGDPIPMHSEPARRNAATVVGHVLIVEDDPEVAALLADCLAPLGLTTRHCVDGATALRRVALEDFDLVFSDIRMPGMDGLAFLNQLERIRPDLARRLVFVSGHVLQDVGGIDLDMRGHAVIEKPFEPAKIRSVACSALERRARRLDRGDRT